MAKIKTAEIVKSWLTEARAIATARSRLNWYERLKPELQVEVNKAAKERIDAGVARNDLARVIRQRLGLAVSLSAICKILQDLETK